MIRRRMVNFMGLLVLYDNESMRSLTILEKVENIDLADVHIKN